MKTKGKSILPTGTYAMAVLCAVVLFFFSSCNPESHNDDYYSIDTTEMQVGGVKIIPVETPKGKFNVWTKRTGNNPKIKVLLLSGGPGLSHEYLEAFESFFPKEGIEFFYYDQLGTGNSDQPKDSTLFDIPRSVEEVEQVRKALNLDKDNFYLYGHSWGGIVAMEYAVKYQQHLKALIVSNMDASGKDYNDYVENVLFKQLPPAVQDTLKQFEDKKDYKNPKYTTLLQNHFYAKYICNMPMDKWPEPLLRAFGKINEPYYNAMQGPSELHVFGKIRDWDIKSRLPQITVPTLTIGAKLDEMNPEHMKWISEQVKNGQYLYCANGSHLSMYDDQQFYMTGVIKFIKDTDSGKGK